MKKILLLLTLPLLAITFNSCSKNDNGGETGGGNEKLVKKIVYEDDYDYYSFEFTYDSQKRITKITEADDAEIGTSPDEMYFYYIAYNGNKVTITYSYTDETTVMTLDDNGYVTREDYSNGGSATYEYSNGVISKSNWSEYTNIFTWNNGNLAKIEYKYLSGDRNEFTTYVYGEVANKMNISYFGDFYNEEFLMFKGIHIKNLPISSTSNGGIETFTYTFDDEGYPTKIVTTFEDQTRNTTNITYY